MKVKVVSRRANEVIVDEYDVTHPVMWKLVMRVIRASKRGYKVTVYVKFNKQTTR